MKICIIGGGPAGIAAARIFSKSGVAFSLFDQYRNPGGQYWRHQKGEKFPESGFEETFAFKNATWRFEATIWQIEQISARFDVHSIQNGKLVTESFDALLIATGAIERPLPVPGWTLPGVMTAGALQSLLKGNGVIPGKKIVIAGSGPFLFPVAQSLQEAISISGSADCEILSILEARNLSRWWRNILGLIFNPEKAIQALGFLISLRKAGLKISNKRAIISIKQSGLNLKRVGVAKVIRDKVSELESEIECDVVAMSFGFTPDLTIPSILKLATRQVLNEEVVAVDGNQKTSKSGVWAAGEVTGIGGHDLAICEGEIAALDILGNSNTPKVLIAKINRARKKIFASGINRIYRPSSNWIDWSDEDVVVCRCEEVSRDEIINSFRELGADSVRTSKLFTRAGMGMCQGRLCHRNVQDIANRFAAGASKINRPIGGAVTLGELSD
jgi:NADPH-dependent 2,4-dienoyl-CoA reductase/sulfur reductase-like enzyme